MDSERGSAIGRHGWQTVTLAVLGLLAPLSIVPTRFRNSPLLWLALLASVAIVADDLRHRARPRPTSVEWLLLAWAGALWLSVALSDDRPIGVTGALRFSVFITVIGAAQVTLRDRARISVALQAIGVGAAIGSVVGLVLLWFGDVPTTRIGPWDRLTRPWTHANVAAMALGSTIFASTVLPRRWRWLGLVAAVALTLTFSRGGVLAVSVAAVVWLVLRRTRGALAAVAAGAVTIIVVASLSPAWTARLGPADQRDWYGVDIAAPGEIRIDWTSDPTEPLVQLGLTNTSTLERAANDVLVSARWFDPDGLIHAEHHWELPADFAPGDRLDAGFSVAPTIADGTWTIWWDLLIGDEAYFRQFTGLDPVITVAEVIGSPATPNAEPWPLVTPRARFERPELWELAWATFVDNPLLGVGPSELQFQVEPERNNDIFPGGHAHSIVLEPLATWGLLGTLPMLGVALIAFFRAARFGDELGAAIVAMMTAVVIHGLVDWPLVFLSVTIPLGIAMGSAIGLRSTTVEP